MGHQESLVENTLLTLYSQFEWNLNRFFTLELVTTLLGFLYLCFYFFCFWQERGEKTEKDPNSVLLFSLFSSFKVGAAILVLHSASWAVYWPGYIEQSTEV